MARTQLVALVILDGWGCAPAGPGNAVELADTPVFDRLWRAFPHTILEASGEAVGLPPGQMGNSEVGHLTIGSGRILDQDLQRVNRAIREGALADNPVLLAALERARLSGGDVHLLGLVSRGGVHSHLDHLLALLTLTQRLGLGERTWVHAFTDGRDVSPHAAADDLAHLPAERIATVSGRMYAMDRDARWERTDRAVAAICDGVGRTGTDPVAAIRRSYAEGVTDEFVEPVVLAGRPRLGAADGDVAVIFNFRADRARQLSQRLVERGLDLTTMTRYSDALDVPVILPEQQVDRTLAQVLSDAGAAQLHVAETEKYAHVTYFFNGGIEDAWPGEARVLIPSPRDVPSYDHKPEMSAPEVARRFAESIGEGYRFGIVNFANPDMVGHTGSIPAVVRALETVDRCLDEVVGAVARAGGVCLVTADHGNAEQMLAADGVSPHTAHTTNPVPLVATDESLRLRAGGELSDLAPTVLDLLGLEQPLQMTGKTLSDLH